MAVWIFWILKSLLRLGTNATIFQVFLDQGNKPICYNAELSKYCVWANYAIIQLRLHAQLCNYCVSWRIYVGISNLCISFSQLLYRVSQKLFTLTFFVIFRHEYLFVVQFGFWRFFELFPSAPSLGGVLQHLLLIFIFRMHFTQIIYCVKTTSRTFAL